VRSTTKSTKKQSTKALAKIEDLQPAPYNPRDIDNYAMVGLQYSMDEFGDISGIVWNQRTGRLVCGHQRVKGLKDTHSEKLIFDVKGPSLKTPDGEVFPIRIVDWDEMKEKAANLAANNPALAGVFTGQVEPLVQELENSMPDLVDALRLQAIKADEQSDIGPDGKVIPEMELQPYEHYDYLLVVATNLQDWEWMCAKFKIEKVQSSLIKGQKKIGLGRAIPAERLIEAFEREVEWYVEGLAKKEAAAKKR